MKLTEEIKQALEAITPGPWTIDEWASGQITVESESYSIAKLNGYKDNDNSRLIANAPTWLSQLLQRDALMVEALKEIRESARIVKLFGYAGIAERALEKVGELE